MGIFTRRENVHLKSEEYEKLTNKFISLEGDVRSAISRMEALKTSFNSLKGWVSRKCGDYSKEDDVSEEKEQTESNIYKDFLPV